MITTGVDNLLLSCIICPSISVSPLLQELKSGFFHLFTVSTSPPTRSSTISMRHPLTLSGYLYSNNYRYRMSWFFLLDQWTILLPHQVSLPLVVDQAQQAAPPSRIFHKKLTQESIKFFPIVCLEQLLSVALSNKDGNISTRMLLPPSPSVSSSSAPFPSTRPSSEIIWLQVNYILSIQFELGVGDWTAFSALQIWSANEEAIRSAGIR